MENELSIDDILIETHAGLERQGIGSPEMTLKALSFIDNIDKISRAIDMGCGTGGQTMILAQNIPGIITGVDLIPCFVDVFNNNARKSNLEKRVNGIVGSILDLSFQKEEFDLIWSEGVIDSIGFEKGISYWNGFLKKNGYIAVTCPSWLTPLRQPEVDKFWSDAGSNLDTVGQNISIMQKCGYGFVASFTLPEKCWTEGYFIPRNEINEALLKKYPENKTLTEYIQFDTYEEELFAKYKEYYGYVFYIGKKIFCPTPPAGSS